MRNSTRNRKAREAEARGEKHRAAGRLSASKAYIEACAEASASRPLRTYPQLSLAWQESLRPSELKDFARIIHLRGIGPRTYRESIGEVSRPARIYDGHQLDRKLHLRARSPSAGSEDFDVRFEDQRLIRTRKSKKLVQRVRAENSIELESRYQLEQAGIEVDVRIAPIESQRIKIESHGEAHPNDVLVPSRGDARARAALTIKQARKERLKPKPDAREAYYSARHLARASARNVTLFLRLRRAARFTALAGPAF